MSTPNYKGPNQPKASGDSWLSSWAGASPTYKTVEKRTDALSSAGSGTVAKPAPGTAQSETTVCAEELDACAVGPIAIVIPRDTVE
ncbi:MAG: hypothetical protein KIT31_16220 [Deltaproteobacteria bacterium]|nr:hypothetical protein [Deltaproteobacteria bacterium]